MPLKFSEDKIEKSLEHMRSLTQDFYGSSEYQSAVTRYERRRDAYYLRLRSTQPQWRSKLHLATFFLSCKATDAQFKASHNKDPFIHVGVSDNGVTDPDAAMKARIAHADLNYDLYTGRFKPKLRDMYWYVELWGTAVGREYIRSKQTVQKAVGRKIDAYGMDLGMMQKESLQRQEFTATDVIHPLNFAHEMTKRDFHSSTWGSVRFPLPISEIYRFLGHPHYHQPGVKEALKKSELNDGTSYLTGNLHFYSERGSTVSEHHDVIVEEYSGPLQFKGNERDQTLYYALYIPSWDIVLRIGTSPYKCHPYWKMQSYPDPDGPYGVGPNDMVLPINYWENSMVNRYNDMINQISKFMYLAQPDYIEGGVNMLINGMPHGIVPLERDTPDPLNVFRPVQNDYNGINAMQGMLTLIEKYKQQQGMSSNLRGKENSQLNDTATGISLIAQREDQMVEMMKEGCDQGIIDAMHMKMHLRTEFFREEVANPVRDNSGMVQHYKYFPYELGGVDYSYRVDRALPDVEAGKHLNFLKVLSYLNNFLAQKGQMLPAGMLIDAMERVGTSLGIQGVDKMMDEVRQSVAPPPQIMGPQGAGGMPGAPGAPAQPGMPQGAPPMPQPEMMGAPSNAMAAIA